jgi:hypothetical protein
MTIELIQGSPEWLVARLGSFGASCLGELMAKGEGKTRAKLIDRIACERICGVSQGWEGNDATKSGNEQEPHAIRAYEALHNVFVEPVGIIRHPRLTRAHASPDALVGDTGGLEIKSHVKFVTHFNAIQAGMAKAHQYQCQWGMACTGREWWDYGHYCHEAPEHKRLHMFPRIRRDDQLIATLFAAIELAEQEVQERIALYDRMAA